MARLKITIEGEMSPEEMRQYLAATWGNIQALSHGTAECVTEVEPVAPQAATPAPVFSEPISTEPEPVPWQPARSSVPGQLSEGQIIELASAGKLSAIVQAILDLGVTDTEAILAEVLRIKSAIPGLAKLSEQQLADRIPRVLEMMK